MSSDPAQALRAAWDRTDDLFARIRDLHQRPIALRHPFLFYVGHLPAFAWNQLAVAALGKPATGSFDELFAFGIDPESEADADSPASWPPIADVYAYRDRVRADLLAMLPELEGRSGVLCQRQRAAWLVVEHELMHHETLLYMVRMADLALYDDAPASDEGVVGEEVEVPGGTVDLGVDFDTVDFAWDNELPRRRIDVPSFRIDSHAVRNVDYKAFVDAGGPVPVAWNDDQVRTCCGPVPLDAALGWPAEVSHDQARAYAEWKGRRLPTEPELARVRSLDGPSARGNLGFRHHLPRPVGEVEPGPSGVSEVVGNGWEHTATAWEAHPGFHPWVETYAGYSADFFDGAHRVVVGASWATDERLARPSFRNWYRHDYPYVFSKFRTVAT